MGCCQQYKRRAREALFTLWRQRQWHDRSAPHQWHTQKHKPSITKLLTKKALGGRFCLHKQAMRAARLNNYCEGYNGCVISAWRSDWGASPVRYHLPGSTASVIRIEGLLISLYTPHPMCQQGPSLLAQQFHHAPQPSNQTP